MSIAKPACVPNCTLLSRHEAGKQPGTDPPSFFRKAGRGAMQFLYYVLLDVLLFCATWAALFALFGSAIVGTFWVLGRLIEALLTPPSVRKRRRQAAIGLNAHHLKRAGQ